MPEDSRLVELMSQMLNEQRLMKAEQQETNRRLGGLSGEVNSLASRAGKLEEQQQITNTILRQHSRDLEKLDSQLQEVNATLKEHTQQLKQITEFLSTRVPHWGDSIEILSKQGSVSGTLKKAG
ncbi:MAG: hypothetical protein AAB393_19280 [Bacteroidota bacterium]